MRTSLTTFILNTYYKIKIPVKYNNFFCLAYNRILDAVFYSLYYFSCSIEKPQLGINNNTRDIPILVSLTSYPQRFNRLHLCLRSLLDQDVKPDKIVLWLSKEQCTFNDLPNSINKLLPYGIEIKFIDNDEKSYKKFLHVNDIYKQSIVICVDDDIIFNTDMISKLLKCHKKFPNCVCANRVNQIKIKNGKPDKYLNWIGTGIKDQNPSHYIMSTTGFGTLYNSSIFDTKFVDYSIIKQLCPTADDLWCKYNEIRKNIKVVYVDRNYKFPMIIRKAQESALYITNIKHNENDKAIESLNKYFGFNWDRF